MTHVSLGGEEGILTVRVTATGLVYTGPCYIYWITFQPSGTSWVLDISDGVETGTTKWGFGSALNVGFHANFSKPMKMDTGIYCETATNITAVTIGYAKVNN
jgi:hypothetical protein